MAQLYSASLQATMTTISSPCHTSLINCISTTDTYILFDKPIYSPLLWSKGRQNVIQCFTGHKHKKLTARWRLSSHSLTKTPNFDWSEKQYWIYQIIVSAILSMYILIFLFKMCGFLWIGWFYRTRRNNLICSIILSNCKTMGAFTQISLPADNRFHTDEILDSLFTRNLSCWLWFKI